MTEETTTTTTTLTPDEVKAAIGEAVTFGAELLGETSPKWFKQVDTMKLSWAGIGNKGEVIPTDVLTQVYGDVDKGMHALSLNHDDLAVYGFIIKPATYEGRLGLAQNAWRGAWINAVKAARKEARTTNADVSAAKVAAKATTLSADAVPDAEPTDAELSAIENADGDAPKIARRAEREERRASSRRRRTTAPTIGDVTTVELPAHVETTTTDKGTTMTEEATTTTTTDAATVGAKEALEILGITSNGALSKLRDKGTVKAEKVNGRWAYDRAELEARRARRDKGEKATASKPEAATPEAATASKLQATDEAMRIARLEAEIAELRAEAAQPRTVLEHAANGARIWGGMARRAFRRSA